KQSGEWAVPFMIDKLLDPSQKNLQTHILSALAEIGKPAVTPLAVSLQMDNNAVESVIVRALGRIGYAPAIPYLNALAESEQTTPDVKSEARAAIGQIEQISGREAAGSAADGFYSLAESYYYDHGSLMSEQDAPVVNVWFWRDGRLTSTQVPPRI